MDKPKAELDELADRAMRAQAAGRLEEAEAVWDDLLNTEPRHNIALYFLALIREQRKESARAIDLLARCVASAIPAPPTAQHHAAYAAALGRAGRHDDALAASENALASDPALIAALHTRGVALEALGRNDEAIAQFRDILKREAEHPETLAALGAALAKSRADADQQEALNLLRRAGELRPNSVQVLANLGTTLRRLGRLSEALTVFRQLVDAHPHLPEARNNLGVCLQESGDLDGARQVLEAAIGMRGDYAEARWNLGLVRLMSGDLTGGWLDYEWRRRLAVDRAAPAAVPQPEWNGCALHGRTILLRAEQGLGDTMQFVRYAPLLKARGARVVLECQPKLVALMRSADGLDQIVEQGSTLPSFDTWIRLLSLPGVFAAGGDAVPATIPYLRAERARVERWSKVLAGFSGFKVGIAWQGNPAYPGDRSRSIALAAFEPLARIPGVRLLSLQKGLGVDQLPEARDRFLVHDFTPPLDDDSPGAFLDTAAVIAALNLIITSDTALAHLAGALGAPTWVALAHVPDWRWMLGRDDSPWYPTMRLFRQQRRGDWRGVFEAIAHELEAKAGAPRAAPQVSLPAPPGELVDRITILEIKAARITEEAKLKNVRKELAALRDIATANLPTSAELTRLSGALVKVNETLWEIEDAIRERESRQDFGEEFIALARAVYHTNDQRSRLKREINDLLGARFSDEKSYVKY